MYNQTLDFVIKYFLLLIKKWHRLKILLLLRNYRLEKKGVSNKKCRVRADIYAFQCALLRLLSMNEQKKSGKEVSVSDMVFTLQ